MEMARSKVPAKAATSSVASRKSLTASPLSSRAYTARFPATSKREGSPYLVYSANDWLSVLLLLLLLLLLMMMMVVVVVMVCARHKTSSPRPPCTNTSFANRYDYLKPAP